MEFWTTTDLVINGAMLTVTFSGLYLWIRSLWVSKVQFGTYLLDRSTAARWGLIDVGVVVMLWVIIQSVAAISFLGWYDITMEQAAQSGLSPRFGLTVKIVELIAVLIGLAYLFSKFKHQPNEFGLSTSRFNEAFCTGLICFLMWMPVVWTVHSVLSEYIPYQHETLSGLKSSTSAITVFDLWLTAVVLAPVIEEILFRGIIQSWIQRCRFSALENPDSLLLGERPQSLNAENEDELASGKKARRKNKRPLHLVSIVLTSAMFGALHFGQGAAPISLFVLSLGLGYLYQRTGNLMACIVTHMILNAFTMAIVTFGS